MKNESIRTVLTALVFGSVLFSLACGGGGDVSNSGNAGVAAADPCRPQLNYTQKVDELTTAINAEIAKKTKLQKQKTDGKFSFSFQPFTDLKLIQIIVTGSFYSVDGDKESTMENFFDTFDEHLKAGCIEKVSVAAPPTVPGAQSQVGDLWQLCEYPNEYCQNGECKAQGTCMISANVSSPNPVNSTTNVNSTSTTNPNSNSNTNSNSKSNVNSGNGKY